MLEIDRIFRMNLTDSTLLKWVGDEKLVNLYNQTAFTHRSIRKFLLTMGWMVFLFLSQTLNIGISKRLQHIAFFFKANFGRSLSLILESNTSVRILFVTSTKVSSPILEVQIELNQIQCFLWELTPLKKTLMA